MKNRNSYGSPKVIQKLHQQRVNVSERTVTRIMNRHQLVLNRQNTQGYNELEISPARSGKRAELGLFRQQA